MSPSGKLSIDEVTPFDIGGSPANSVNSYFLFDN